MYHNIKRQITNLANYSKILNMKLTVFIAMAVGFASVTSRTLEELEWGNSDPKGKYSQSVDKNYIESHFNYSISITIGLK